MLKTRIITSLLLVAVFLLAIFLLPTPILGIALALMLLVGAWEWSRLAKLSVGQSCFFYIAIITLMILAYVFKAQVESWILWVSLLWWSGISFMIMRYKPAESKASASVDAVSKSLMGLVVLVPAWWALVQLHGAHFGIDWFIYTFCIVWFADVGAYFSGKRFGKHKLAPEVSPGKTIEGLMGGLMAVGVLSVLGLMVLDINDSKEWLFVLLSLIVATFSVFGDLFESLLKRQAGVKDSSQLLPGHGGVLDRIDSVLAAAPLFLLGLIVLKIT